MVTSPVLTSCCPIPDNIVFLSDNIRDRTWRTVLTVFIQQQDDFFFYSLVCTQQKLRTPRKGANEGSGFLVAPPADLEALFILVHNHNKEYVFAPHFQFSVWKCFAGFDSSVQNVAEGKAQLRANLTNVKEHYFSFFSLHQLKHPLFKLSKSSTVPIMVTDMLRI